MRFQLGLGPGGMLLVTAMFLAAGAYFGWAGWTGQTEPLVAMGRAVAGRETMRMALYAAAVVMSGAGFYLLLRSLLNFGRGKYVELDVNRIVISGFAMSGGEEAITYAEIDQVLEYSVRGIAAFEITSRNGSRLVFSQALFRNSAEFDRFRAKVKARVPVKPL